jgi:hypothetical protein
MAEPFTEQQKQYIRDRIWWDEWDDGTLIKDDICNLTSSNWSNFIQKIQTRIYEWTLDYANEPHFKSIKSKVDFEKCKKYPEHIQQELSNLYLNGMVPHFDPGYHFECFNTLFRMYQRMYQKLNELTKYEDGEEASPFVESLLTKVDPVLQLPTKQVHIDKNLIADKNREVKPKRYIINGILY